MYYVWKSYKILCRRLEEDDTKLYLNEIRRPIQHVARIYRSRTVSSIGSCKPCDEFMGFTYLKIWEIRYISQYCPSLRVLRNNVYLTGHTITVTCSNNEYRAVNCNRIQVESFKFTLSETQFGVKILIEKTRLYPKWNLNQKRKLNTLNKSKIQWTIFASKHIWTH
jgi:hypothetical protein